MRRVSVRLVVFALAASLASPLPVAGQELSPDASRVVDYLLADWQRQFSSTTIPHAMQYIGLEPDDELRLEVIEHLRANDGLAQNLQWWGANNYLFSNFEKRLAKYLILTHERVGEMPSLAQAAETFGVPEAEIALRLTFMTTAGFLQTASTPLGFGLAPGYRRWAGPLQHNFHTVRIEGEAPLDVW